MPTRAQGFRPSFFADPASDRLVDMIVRLTGEVSVLYDRVDTLETLLARAGVLSDEQLSAHDLDPVTAEQREPARAQLLARVLRILERERESLAAGESAQAYQDFMTELSRPSDDPVASPAR